MQSRGLKDGVYDVVYMTEAARRGHYVDEEKDIELKLSVVFTSSIRREDN